MIEPIVEKVFDHKGYKCAVLFHPLGHRCGYVRLVKGSKYFETDYNEIPVATHGGLTYRRHCLSGVEEASDDTWWIGWDYAHCYDGADMESYKKYYGEPNPYLWFPEGTIYSKDDVIADCKCVVDQLIGLEEGE